MFNLIVSSLRIAFLFGLYCFLFIVLRTVYRDMRRRESAAPRLIAMKGSATRGSSYALSGALVIGRDADGGLSIPDPFISSHHVKLYPEGSGFIIEDLGSANGTSLNGRRLTAPEKLNPGDRVKIGETIFQYME